LRPTEEVTHEKMPAMATGLDGHLKDVRDEQRVLPERHRLPHPASRRRQGARQERKPRGAPVEIESRALVPLAARDCAARHRDLPLGLAEHGETESPRLRDEFVSVRGWADGDPDRGRVVGTLGEERDGHGIDRSARIYYQEGDRADGPGYVR
jgi:hypothetical protein